MGEIEKKKWKRNALEGYVDAKDSWYFDRCVNLINLKERKVTTLVVASAATVLFVNLILNFLLLRMFLKR